MFQRFLEIFSMIGVFIALLGIIVSVCVHANAYNSIFMQFSLLLETLESCHVAVFFSPAPGRGSAYHASACHRPQIIQRIKSSLDNSLANIHSD